jgi:hypothetical protein
MTKTLEYPYHAKPWVMIAGVLFFGACSVGMGYAAVTNDRELILNGIITFSVTGATLFYWCIAAVAVLFVVAALYAVITGLNRLMMVRLTTAELSSPKSGFSKTPTLIPLQDIQEINLQSVQGQRFIRIISRLGKLDIAQSMLPDAASFEELYRELVSRARI